jgi:hypothetical protein
MSIKVPRPAFVEAVNVTNTTKHDLQVRFAYDDATKTLFVKIDPPQQGNGQVIIANSQGVGAFRLPPDWNGTS